MERSDEILTVSEVAQYLKVKPLTVYRWIKAGKIPVMRLGRTVRFRKAVIDEWLKGKTQTEFKPGRIKKERRERRQ